MVIREHTQEDIDNIVKLFYEAKIWNDGKFSKAVEDYCEKEGLDVRFIHKQLETAFYDMLATTITSENAIRFRLKIKSW